MKYRVMSSVYGPMRTVVDAPDEKQAMALLIEHHGDRIPVTKETLSRLPRKTRYFWCSRIRNGLIPTELAMRCLLNMDRNQNRPRVPFPSWSVQSVTRPGPKAFIYRIPLALEVVSQ